MRRDASTHPDAPSRKLAASERMLTAGWRILTQSWRIAGHHGNEVNEGNNLAQIPYVTQSLSQLSDDFI